MSNKEFIYGIGLIIFLVLLFSVHGYTIKNCDNQYDTDLYRVNYPNRSVSKNIKKIKYNNKNENEIPLSNTAMRNLVSYDDREHSCCNDEISQIYINKAYNKNNMPIPNGLTTERHLHNDHQFKRTAF